MVLDIALGGAMVAGIYSLVAGAMVIAYRRTLVLHLELASLFLLGVSMGSMEPAPSPLLGLAVVAAAVIAAIAQVSVHQPLRQALWASRLIASVGVAVMVMAIAVPWHQQWGAAHGGDGRISIGTPSIPSFLLEVSVLALLACVHRHPPRADAVLLACLGALSAAAGLALGLAGGSGALGYRIMVLPLLAIVISGARSLRGSVWGAAGIGISQALIEVPDSAPGPAWTLPIMVLVAVAARSAHVARA